MTGRITRRWRWFKTSRQAQIAAWLLLSVTIPSTRGDDSPLTVADLADYRRSLIARDSEPVPRLLRFRELWDHPTKYAGVRVQVEGRIVRRFLQGAFGTFPPLVEAWAVTPSGDPFCWVYPAPKDGASTPPVQESVRFVGTYLKRIRYQGGDTERLAPLIVGPRPPSSPPRPTRPPVVRSRNAVNDWILGISGAGVVIAVLVWQHLRKPVSSTFSHEPGAAYLFDPPLFQDGDQEGSNDEKCAGPTC
ncbi:hypothetical protein V5E97_13555 [Singulisphaera sp. Ch08]|uniref:Uncharacterized protein n=1 Tax=Singulisphaera sp. Ch08 TaxID=3120278 RepID=A0AAU7CQV4_9BACT